MSLKLRQLSFGYQPARPLIKEADAQVKPGRLHMLMGPNGAGKSTLLKLMLGLLNPTGGAAELDGADVRTLAPSLRAARLAYVPQQTQVVFPFTVDQMLAMGRLAAADSMETEREIRQSVLEACGLYELTPLPFNHLSLGQRQRVLLGRALAQLARGVRPDGLPLLAEGSALLLDEPVSAMDLKQAHQTMALVRRVIQPRSDEAAHAPSAVMIAQDMNLSLRYADEVWLLHEGRLLGGETDRMLQPPLLEEVFGVRLSRGMDAQSGRIWLDVERPGP